jgi:phytoene dehydrogenase-like protein
VTTAVVVGSGPNGLAAAITLAQQGVAVTVLEASERIGGGARTSEHTLPGLLHDDCSAVHPTAVASPLLRSLRLEKHGLRWAWPEIDLAHPLDGGRAGLLFRDLRSTAEGLGADGEAWARLFGPLARRFDDLVDDVFRPVLRVPSHPLTMLRFGLGALQPATVLARRWRDDEARALFAGVAAHLFGSLHTPLSSSVGLMLTAAGHAHGWPVAVGGSQAITGALAARLDALGGVVKTGVEVRDLNELDAPDVVLLSTSPRAAARILGDRLPPRVRRAYRRYRYGPAAFKVDFAVEGDVPWTNPDVGRAGTVHLGGTLEELAGAEGAIVRGALPSRPFVLVGQQYLADRSRSRNEINPVWAYAHVPAGHRGDVTPAIVAQIERFAPGFEKQVRATFVRDVAAMEAYNANYVGGDICVGANDPIQVSLRPRLTPDPYATGVEGVYLCSSATPPGAGVHGMCGHNAARSALRWLRRR